MSSYDDDPDTDESDDSVPEWMQRIADALEERLGIDLGDLSMFEGDEDRFAHAVEIAVKNRPKPKRKKQAVQMSQTRKKIANLVRTNRAVAWFQHHVNDEDKVADAFNRIVNS